MAKHRTDTEEDSVRRVREATAAGTLTGDPDGPPASALAAPKPPRDKAAKFRKLANQRVPQLLKRIRHVANLANRGSYEYTEEQKQRLLKTVNDAVKALVDAFTATGPADGKGEQLF